MPRAPSPAVNPAADAAALLRRVGFAMLMLVVPVTALVTRRAVVVLVPVGVVLLVLAALLDPGHRGFRESLRRVAASRVAVAGGLVLVWCALSLAWTPFIGPASERLLSIVGTIGVAIAGFLALPDRMRSANLYIVPVGVAVAAVAAILLALFGSQTGRGLEEDGQSLERGLVVLVLLVWPSIGWLRSRERDLEALLLAVVVAIATVLGPHPMPVVALAVGAVAYAVTAITPRLGVRATGLVMGGLVALAPLIPLIARPVMGLVLGPQSPTVISLAIWRRIVLNEPLRLITGHGFETALRGRFVGLLPPNAPSSLLFEIWYELGIVGALAGAGALYAAAMSAGREPSPLTPGVMAAFAAAFSFACLGIGTAQMWWFTALATLVVIFVAAERGQFRTTRPKARFLRAANDA